jgi:histidinol-phosphate phosphatase family protein
MSLATPKTRVAILAGGQGTRLAARAGPVPKPMVQLLGKPVLEHQIELCRKHGFDDIALLVHHQHEVISEYFGDGLRFGVRLRYEIESSPRGTAGALRDALARLANRFLVLYGDTYLDVDLARFWSAHLAQGASATLFLHPNDHPQDSDLVEVDASDSILALHSYPHPQGKDFRNLVNAALYALDREGLEAFTPAQGRGDIAKHMFPAMLAAGKRLQGYISPEYVKDMGTPERLDKVERDIDFGLPERLSTRQLRSAVFLDRDGTLNVEVDHLRDPVQLSLLGRAGEAVRRLNRAGRLAVVTTNQPVIARGEASMAQLAMIHARLESLLGEHGAYLDGLYVCPHHPHGGFPGEVASLKIVCQCRKPLPGMLHQACRDLNIDAGGAWMVGDSTVDIEAGRSAGARTVLVRTGHAGRDERHVLRPDYVAANLLDAVDWILDGHPATCRAMLPVAAAAHSRRLVLMGGLARSGKSSAAQVLKELLLPMGRTAHVISLDSWLKPPQARSEGCGVLSRFDVQAALDALIPVIGAPRRVILETAVYDRFTRNMHRHLLAQSIGPQDTLIVEGVPALIIEKLRATEAAVAVFVNASAERRRARLAADYRWRGIEDDRLEAILASREIDETGTVVASSIKADFVVTSEGSA